MEIIQDTFDYIWSLDPVIERLQKESEKISHSPEKKCIANEYN